MTQNQSEEQCLIKYFKYFDMDNIGKLNEFKNKGFCNLRDFIKTIEKIGVVLPRVHDIQLVFDFYDNEKNGRIDYKKLSQDIFDSSKKEKRNFTSNDKVDDSYLNKNQFDILARRK